MKDFNPDQAPAVIDRTMMETAISRAAQEVQAAMVIAKKFPRDENAAYAKIMKACARNGLAEVACYAYPRGGTTVTGPSIRLAETLKMAWGNVESGIVELEQKSGESIVMSYAWDLETNSKETKIFTVKHERHTRQGVNKLTDPRDIYELVANQGARRLRACILAVIPGDVVDAAVEACDKTLKGDGKEPLADRARKMTVAFEGYGVTLPMIEARLGHKLDALIEQELVNLRKIYNAIKDGAAKRDDFFQLTGPVADVVAPTKRAKKPSEDAPKEDGDKIPMGEPAQHESVESIPEDPTELVKFVRGMVAARDLEESSVVAFLKAKHKCGAGCKTLGDVAQSGLRWIAENLDVAKDEISAL